MRIGVWSSDVCSSVLVDADLLDRARRPLVESMTKARRENAYWLKYVAEATTHPDRLDRSRNAIAEVEAATPADQTRLARRYLRDDKAPVNAAGSDKAGTTGTTHAPAPPPAGSRPA